MRRKKHEREMLPTTIQIIKSGLQGDPTVSPSDRARLMAVLRNGATPQSKPESPPPDNTPRLIHRAEAASRLSRSLRFVDTLAASGVLPKRKLPGRVRASGFLESDLVALLTANAKE
jgi:hypothetical protein